ncbi:MAG TPA: TRAP transporter small permease subunit [Kofleriaceae bacterium]
MSEPADGDGSGEKPAAHSGTGTRDDLDDAEQPSGAVKFEDTVPPTRRQSSAELAEAAHRPALPDDGPVSAWLRGVDRALGTAEQAVLFGLLGAVVLTAAAAALSDRLLHVPLGRWWFDIVRGGTFSVAMIGAVFATHQQRHLAMDLVSRRLPARGRLALRVVLALFTVLVVVLLLRSGLHQLDTVGEESGDHLISTHTIVTFMPAGASLIILHTLLHMVIDIDYLLRGKTPPERMRSGH